MFSNIRTGLKEVERLKSTHFTVNYYGIISGKKQRFGVSQLPAGKAEILEFEEFSCCDKAGRDESQAVEILARHNLVAA